MNQARRETVRTGAASAPRILVVEDESDLAVLLSYNLEAEGYVVESVERGDEAELRLAENPPDLVILDWMLPGVSGLEICRRLRARCRAAPNAATPLSDLSRTYLCTLFATLHFNPQQNLCFAAPYMRQSDTET